MAPVLVLVFIVLLALAVFFYKKPPRKVNLPANYKALLAQHVAFYRALDEAGKSRFEEKIKELLGYIRIHGVNTTVDDVDRLLVAAGGVIPIFGFPEWKYYNLTDVLLYPDTFNRENFSAEGHNRDILGMVGEGALQRVMILSKPALHQGFDDMHGRENTAIHEFVHLLDKEDGAVDGLPEALLNRQYTHPWLQQVAEGIEAIKSGHSDINSYGATNKAEFFAVAAEFFFTRPEEFRHKHPELYVLMLRVFQQEPLFLKENTP
ncbi:MAG TPA: zinc-dependent peptidase [Chitinophagaceae bacterium]|nr:zinc-dependent peptidase [Chitinophagaceae bacterium]